MGASPEFSEEAPRGLSLSRVGSTDGRSMQQLPGSWMHQALGRATDVASTSTQARLQPGEGPLPGVVAAGRDVDDSEPDEAEGSGGSSQRPQRASKRRR